MSRFESRPSKQESTALVPRHRSGKRRLWSTTWIMFGFLVLLQYQNCARPGSTSSNASTDASSPVTIIDKNNQGFDVSFAQAQVTIQSSVEAVNLNGVCSQEQDGSIFQWQLKGADGSLLDSGSASCQAGAFVVAIAPTQALDCGQPYQVSAQMGTGQAGEVVLTRNCSAAAQATVSGAQKSLASDVLRALLDSAAADSQCVTEQRPGDGSGCSIACYSAAGVEQRREALPGSACDL